MRLTEKQVQDLTQDLFEKVCEALEESGVTNDEGLWEHLMGEKSYYEVVGALERVSV